MRMSSKRNARRQNHNFFYFLSSFLIIAVHRFNSIKSFFVSIHFFFVGQIDLFCLWKNNWIRNVNINNTCNTSALNVYKYMYTCMYYCIVSGKYAYNVLFKILHLMIKQYTTAESIFDFFIVILLLFIYLFYCYYFVMAGCQHECKYNLNPTQVFFLFE